MKQLLYIFLALLSAEWFTSCKGPEELRQQLIYFKNLKDSSLKVAQAYEPLIQQGDIISISVSGNILEKEAALPLLEAINKTSSASGGGTTGAIGISSAEGYLVNEAGSIIVPFLGEIKIGGLTKIQAAAIIQEQLKKEIVNPIVEVRLLNFKVTILGEIGSPGQVKINNDKITILDAIGAAGDLTINGKRDNIMIIRDNNGQKEIGRLNLNDGNIFTSPYYFLKQNDIVYVEMNKLKLPEQQNKSITYFQFGLAVITSISLLINIFK